MKNALLSFALLFGLTTNAQAALMTCSNYSMTGIANNIFNVPGASVGDTVSLSVTTCDQTFVDTDPNPVVNDFYPTVQGGTFTLGGSTGSITSWRGSVLDQSSPNGDFFTQFFDLSGLFYGIEFTAFRDRRRGSGSLLSIGSFEEASSTIQGYSNYEWVASVNNSNGSTVGFVAGIYEPEDASFQEVTINTNPVPVPATLALIGLGLIGIRRRRSA